MGTFYNGGNGGSGIVVLSYSGTPATVFPYWSSNANTAETSSLTALTAFLANGFTIGSNSLFNTSGNNYISWMWKKSATAGVDIVTYTGDNTANRNISHSLGAAPDMVIVKRRDSTGDPFVWHSSLAGATSFLLMDSTAAVSTTNTPWGTGNFSSTQFMVTNNATNNTNAASATSTAPIDSRWIASSSGCAPGARASEPSYRATVWAAALMLEHLGEEDAAALLVRAVETVARPGPHAADLAGRATTGEVAAGVIAAIGQRKVTAA